MAEIGAGSVVRGRYLLLEKLGQGGDLDCTRNECEEPGHRVDRYNALRDWSAVGFWVGAPLLAAGAGALWWSQTPDRESSNAAGVNAWLGLGEASVSARC